MFVFFVVLISSSGSSGSSGVFFINIGCHGFQGFFVFVIVFVFVFVIVFVFVLYRFRFRFRFLLSPIQELEPGATPYRGGRCAAGYPRGLQQP